MGCPGTSHPTGRTGRVFEPVGPVVSLTPLSRLVGVGVGGWEELTHL